jgi:hypothetical protein
VVQTVLGPAPAPTTYRVQYGTGTHYGQSTPVRRLQGEGGSMLELLRGLKAGVVYHFRAVAQNSAGQTFGRDESLATLGRRRPALDVSLSLHGSSPHRSAVMTATQCDRTAGEGRLRGQQLSDLAVGRRRRSLTSAFRRRAECTSAGRSDETSPDKRLA